MIGSVISRWTMPHFWAALVFFVAAQAEMAAGISYPQAALAVPATLAAVHLLTIGWITLLMLGALHQFLPVITAQPIVADKTALISLIVILAGLAGMEAGFFALSGFLPLQCLSALPVGGMLVLAGFGIGLIVPVVILWRTRPLPFSAQFIAAGLGFLLMAATAGIVMAFAFASPGLLPWLKLSPSFRLHLLAGMLGWFTLTAMGVSYRLLSMFTLAPEERGPIGTAVLVLSAGGTATAWLIGLLNEAGLIIPGETTALAAAAAGAVLYLFDIARLYRARRRMKLELNTAMALPPLAAFAICLAGLLAIAGGAPVIGPVGYLFIFGWLSGLGLSQLYKIIPFLTWLERYGEILGRENVPRVQDLVDEHRDRAWFWLYFAAVALGFTAGSLGWVAIWRLAIAFHLVATLMIVRAFAFARRPLISPKPNASAGPGDAGTVVFPFSHRGIFP